MTNGEKIKEIFPSVQITECESYIQVMGENFEFNNTYSKRWWNAEYKEPTIKNGISNKSIIYKAKESKKIQEDLDKLSELNKTATKNDLGVDAISREKAIKFANIFTEYHDVKTANELIMEMLSEIPSVTPQEPRKGHWTEEFNDLEGEVRFTCSSCGKYQLFGTDFCYHCGSDNREVVEE